jgi:hypothetical protein
MNMNTPMHYEANVKAHQEMLLREAEQERLANGAEKLTQPNMALATLGRLMVEVGERLQSQYSADEAQPLQHQRA